MERKAVPVIQLIDAGIRQLLTEGFMHNRLRINSIIIDLAKREAIATVNSK